MHLTKEARDALPATAFAVPSQRKLPLVDATHVKLAWNMVDQTKGLTSADRLEARNQIVLAAKAMNVDLTEMRRSTSISMEALSVEMPDVPDHPNKMPFKGVMTRVDEPSDNPPGGANGKRVTISSAVAEAALPSLIGMAIDATKDFDGHDAQRKIGIITGANVVGNAIEIEGYFYANDFPAECRHLRAAKDHMGFSYECLAAIQDPTADVLNVEYCVFTGAAVLYKDLAAYTSTSLSAQADQGNTMDLKELIAAMAAQTAAIQAQAEATKVTNDKIGAALEAFSAAKTADPVTPAAPVAPVAAAAAPAAPAVDFAAALTAAMAPVLDKVSALSTQVEDMKSKAFAAASAPARATLTPEIRSLLAKGNVAEDQMTDGKLSLQQVDAMLEAQGIKGTQAIEAKLKLRAAGILQAGR